MYRLSTVICQVLEFSILSIRLSDRKGFVADICIHGDATCFDILRVCVCVCVSEVMSVTAQEKDTVVYSCILYFVSQGEISVKEQSS